jgi:hypothetical protein
VGEGELMAGGPWEKYAAQESGAKPWEKYAGAAAPASVSTADPNAATRAAAMADITGQSRPKTMFDKVVEQIPGAKEFLFTNALEAAGAKTATDLYDAVTGGLGDVAAKALGTPKGKLAADFPAVPFVSELVRSVPEVIDFSMTPAGALAIAGGRKPALRPAIGATFSTDMAQQIPGAVQEAVEHPSPESMANAVKLAAFTAAPVLHARGEAKAEAAKRAPIRVAADTPKQAAETAAALMDNEDLALARTDPQASADVVSSEIARRRKAGEWDAALDPKVQPKPKLPRASIPEEGDPHPALTYQRANVSAEMAGKTYDALTADERVAVDDLVRQGYGFKEAAPLADRAPEKLPEPDVALDAPRASNIPESNIPAPEVPLTVRPAELPATRSLEQPALSVEAQAPVATPSLAPEVTPAPSILERLEASGREASERLRGRLSSTSSANEFLNPETIRDMALSIAGDVARGTLTLADLSKRLSTEYGPKARAVAKKVWQEAQSVVGLQRATELTRVHPFEVSTRQPSAVKATEHPVRQLLVTGMDSWRRSPESAAKNVLKMRQYPNFSKIGAGNTEKVAEKMTQHAVENLLWLHDQVPEVQRKRAKLWYDGANKIAKTWAKEYQSTEHQVAGVLAVFSPQKDWYQNVDMGRRMLDFWKQRQALRWAPQMEDAWLKVVDAKNKSDAQRAQKAKARGTSFNASDSTLQSYERIKGKSFSEIEKPKDQALWFRLWDEGLNPREYRVVTPEGDFGELVTKKAKDGEVGESGSVAWSGFNAMEKAISILTNGSLENISKELGSEHKVRNFYNNINVPNSTNGHVTIDTHAVAAALLRPLSGKSQEVMHNFGGGASSSAMTGEGGTYGLYADAYRKAAAQRGILPREMQSITWEAVRGLFGKTFKTATNQKLVDDVWRRVSSGKMSIEEGRQYVHNIAGGIDNPTWFDEGRTDRGVRPGDRRDASGRSANDARRVPVAGVSGSGLDARGTAGRGAGSDSAKAIPPVSARRRATQRGSIIIGESSPEPETAAAAAPPKEKKKAAVKAPAADDSIPVSPSYEETKGNILDKLDVSDKVKSAVAAAMDVRDAANPERRRITNASIEAAAREVDPSIVLDLDRKAAQELALKNNVLFHAIRKAIPGLLAESVELRKAIDAAPRDKDILEMEKQWAKAEQDVQKLLNVTIPVRSQHGRNLAMHKMTVDTIGFDPTYWVGRAKKSLGLPADASLPVETQREISSILAEGREAEGAAIKAARRKAAVRKAIAEAAPGERPNVEIDGESPPTAAEKAAIEKSEGVQAAKRKLARKMAKLEKTTLLETIAAVRRAGLLTSPRTAIRNFGGNLTMQVLEETSRIPASMIDIGLSLFTDKRTVSGVDTMAVARASRAGLTKGVREAAQIMRQGATDEQLAQFDFHKELTLGPGRPSQVLEKYVNFVFRLQSAQDRVFKRYAIERSLEEQMKLAGADSPTEAMMAQAIADADFATFNNKNKLHDMYSRARAGASPGARFALDMALPFVRTPANVLARVIDYSGGGVGKGAAAGIKAAIAKSLTAEQQRYISQNLGRGLTGPALIYLGYQLAANGLATGTYQPEAGKRNTDEAAGRLSGAVKIGGTWQMVSPLSPGGALITIGATLQREATGPLKDEAKRPDKVLMVAGRTILDHPMLQGAKEFADAIADPGARGQRVAASMAGSFIPSAVSDVASLADDVRRDTRTDGGVLDAAAAAMASRTPGLRNTLPERKDVLGRPLPQTKSAVVNPGIGSPAKEDSNPIVHELVRNRVSIGDPRRDVGEPLDQYRLRRELVGREIEKQLGLVVNSPQYARLETEEQRRNALDKAELRARRLADAKLGGKAYDKLTPAKRMEKLRGLLER